MQDFPGTEASATDVKPYGFWTSALWAAAADALAAAVIFGLSFILLRLKIAEVLAEQIVLGVSSLVLVVVVLVAVQRRAGIVHYLALERARPRWIFIAIAGLVIIQMGGGFIGDRFGVGASDVSWELAEYKKLLASNVAIILALINLPLLAPLTEEVLFRGFLYRGWAASALGPVGTIVLTSLLFGALHVQYSWYGLAIVTALGLWFGVVRWRSGSLVPSLVAHCFGNAMVSVEAFFAAMPN